MGAFWEIVLLVVIVLLVCMFVTLAFWSLSSVKEAPIVHIRPRTPWTGNIERITEENTNYRTVVATGQKLQLTTMSILPAQDIGDERHPDTDQFLRVEQGTGRFDWRITPNGRTNEKPTANGSVSLVPGSAMLIPAGTWHNVTNTGATRLQLYSLYAPPEHPPNRVQPLKPLVD